MQNACPNNAPICHEAGIQSKTLSDLVMEIQYVDANGVLREVADPSLLRAAAGCFGLLGKLKNTSCR